MAIHNQPVYPIPFTDGFGSVFQGVNSNGESMWASDPGGLTKLELFTKDIYCAMLSKSNTPRKSMYVEALHRAHELLDTIEKHRSVTNKLNQ